MTDNGPKLAAPIVLLNEQLFRAWESGDPSARHDVWEETYEKIYKRAEYLAFRFTNDRDTARRWAHDALLSALAKVERDFVEEPGKVAWLGARQFASYMLRGAKYAVMQQWYANTQKTQDSAEVFKDDSEEEWTDNFVVVPPDQEQAVLVRRAIAAVVKRLLDQRIICRGRRALIALIDAKLDYIHFCCKRAVPNEDAQSLGFDEAAAAMDVRIFRSESEEMSEFVMQQLDLNRRAFDSRQAQVKGLVARSAAGQPPPEVT